MSPSSWPSSAIDLPSYGAVPTKLPGNLESSQSLHNQHPSSVGLPTRLTLWDYIDTTTIVRKYSPRRISSPTKQRPRQSRGDSSPTTPRCSSRFARNPDVRTRDVAEAVGITERAARRIVADLRRSRATSKPPASADATTTPSTRQITMRHPARANHEIGELLDLLKPDQHA